MTQELRKVVNKKGAKTIHDERFAYPFMDSNEEIHQERMDLIINFFMEFDNNE